MDTKKALLIARYGARYSVRGGVGLVFLLLSLTFGLMVAHLTLQPVELLSKQVQERMQDEPPEKVTERVLERLTDEARRPVAWLLSERTAAEATPEQDRRANAWAEYLLKDRPAMLSAIFLILLFGWPLVGAFGAFDLYAGDISSRQLRYQLLRADRASIYFGRLIGTTVTFVLVLTLLGATVAVYMAAKLPLYALTDVLAWTVYGVLALTVVTLPYLALCAWISASVSGAFTSLTVVSLVVGGVPLVAMFGRMSHEAAGYVNFLLPWGFQTRLFHYEPTQVALAGAGCALQTVLYTWLGYRKFTRRDL
ncbi:MAG: hypothetical protein H6835_08045 [Planctomycetes bacterium]|nr:hypothetical protein [Planctomycetota bacterium]